MATPRPFDELVTRACERAGLDDFGGDSWQEGLQLLVDTCESAPGVNPGGREFVYGQFVDAIWNRLRVVDYITHHPEVADEQVDRPLVVLGLPRTGTSLASYLLDQDPRRRSLLTWEAEDSVPPSTPDTLRTDPRCLKKKAELEVLAEGLKAANIPLVHWDEADGPTECLFVQNQDFKAYLWESFMPTPEYAEWLLRDRHDKRIRLPAQGITDAAVARTGHLVAEDAFPRGAHRSAAGDLSRRAYRLGAPRPVSGDRVLLAPELSVALGDGRRDRSGQHRGQRAQSVARACHPPASDPQAHR